MRRWLSAAAVLLVFPSLAAMEAAPISLAEGKELPAFSLPSVAGGEVSLGRLTAEGPAVLVIYRGVW